MKPLTIPPNQPVTLALIDTEGQFDFEVGIGRYQTTTGQLLTLPRPAVVILNTLDPKPGEEIVITKHWTGKPGDKAEWTIALAHSSEMARSEAGEPDTLTEQLEASLQALEDRKAPVAIPTPIRKPFRKAPDREVQPRLFDRGNGTHGPLPATEPAATPVPLILPAAARSRMFKPEAIPANVAVREILCFIKSDPSTANWGDQAVQDLASTVIIAAYKAGHVGLWERK